MRIVFGALIFAVRLSAVMPAQGQAPVTIEQHEAAMKGVQQAMGAMNKNLKGGMLTEAGANAEELGKLFAQVEAFWTQQQERRRDQACGAGASGCGRCRGGRRGGRCRAGATRGGQRRPDVQAMPQRASRRRPGDRFPRQGRLAREVDRAT